MAVTRMRAESRHSLTRQNSPSAHHWQSHLRVELEAKGSFTVAKGLSFEFATFCEQSRSPRQIEAFTVPLIDMAGKAARAKLMPMFRGIDGIIADLDASLRMRANAVAKMAGQHLGAEANAEKGFAFFEGNADPVDFAAYPGLLVIDTHRTAKDNDAGMVFQPCRQGIAKPRAPDIKGQPLRPQNPSKPSRRRMLLVQNDKNPAK